jgi:EAL domain-containing protein (putative c-di-GMP-specific phosphodiesterase class I)
MASIEPVRLLGFAFASADLLIELTPEGQVALALGAGEALSGSPDVQLTGRAWRDFVDSGDQPMLRALLEGLEPGRRSGPVVVRLKGGKPARFAALTAFRLAENNGAVSCVLTRAAEPASSAGAFTDPAAFERLAASLAEAAMGSGGDLELTLLELSGLAAARAKAPVEEPDFQARLQGVLRAQSFGGRAALAMGEERFALVRDRAVPTDIIAKRVSRLLGEFLQAPISAKASATPLRGEANPKRIARALRLSLDAFLKEGASAATAENLGDIIKRSMQATLEDAGALRQAIDGRNFRLAYQPVVSLADGTLHHFEALVRFGPDESPFPSIRLAEELEFIELLDLAVLEEALKALKALPRATRVAVNVSGRSITSDSFIAKACQILAAQPAMKGRVLVELTESAAIEDLSTAERHLQRLKALECDLCLDDFGAGAASMAYLQQLKVDLVKIDGRYIRGLQHGGREAAFVKHLVGMCRELGVRTLAEMVETPEVETAVRLAGVDLAQGWLYGAAEQNPDPSKVYGQSAMRPALTR